MRKNFEKNDQTDQAKETRKQQLEEEKALEENKPNDSTPAIDKKAAE